MDKIFRTVINAIVIISLSYCAFLPGCSESVSSDSLNSQRINTVFLSATQTFDITPSLDVNTSGRPGRTTVRQIKNDNLILGYSIDAELKTRSGLFTILLLLDEKLRIKNTHVTSYPWKRGKDITRPAFTEQFKGKGPDDPIMIGKDIDSITGATISSNAMTNGIKSIIKTLNTETKPDLGDSNRL